MELLSNTFLSDNLLNILDIIGTIAFSLSGAMVAIQKKMDVFGVNILAITTAVGGGIIRDIIIGQVPPQTFLHPKFTVISILFATLLFAFYYFKKESFFQTSLYEGLIFLKNHIYACASIVGALLTSTLWDYIDINIAILVGFLSIVCIRILAKHYRLNLPKIP